MGRLTLIAALAILASCEGLMPNRVTVSPYYGMGSIERIGSGPRADSESYGLMVGFGWSLGDEAAMQRNLANLDVNRIGQVAVTTDEPAAPVQVTVEGDKETEKDDPLHVELTNIPKTSDEGLAWFLWALAIMALVISAVLLKRHGVRIPFLNNSKD